MDWSWVSLGSDFLGSWSAPHLDQLVPRVKQLVLQLPHHALMLGLLWLLVPLRAVCNRLVLVVAHMLFDAILDRLVQYSDFLL